MPVLVLPKYKIWLLRPTELTQTQTKTETSRTIPLTSYLTEARGSYHRFTKRKVLSITKDFNALFAIERRF